MSAKDKAIELVDKYQYAIRFDESETQYFANMNSVKECALITIDQMILVLPFTDTNDTLNEYAINLQKYLEQVKHEIEKLCESN
jgi:hypothetical protein